MRDARQNDTHGVTRGPHGHPYYSTTGGGGREAWRNRRKVDDGKVVIGCALTNLGVSALLYALTHSFWPVLALWAGYAITGLPMWIMQEYKRLVQNEIAEVEDGRD